MVVWVNLLLLYGLIYHVFGDDHVVWYNTPLCGSTIVVWGCELIVCVNLPLLYVLKYCVCMGQSTMVVCVNLPLLYVCVNLPCL